MRDSGITTLNELKEKPEMIPNNNDNNEIRVDFHPEMVRAMFDCGKEQASRFRKLGDVGDTFTLTHPDTLEQRKWLIREINQHKLGEVAVHMHKQEGFISEEDFMRFWVKINPEKVDSRMRVYVHFLKPTE
jgi:hypothetical protein